MKFNSDRIIEAVSFMCVGVVVVCLVLAADQKLGSGRLRLQKTYPNGKMVESVATGQDGQRYLTFNCPKCGHPAEVTGYKGMGADHDIWYEPSRGCFALHEKCWAESSVVERVKLLVMFFDANDPDSGWNEELKVKVLKAVLDGK